MRLLQRPVAVVLLVWYLPACSLLGVAGGSSPAPEWRPVDEAGLQQFLADVWWGDLDVLLLDLPPGTGDVAISVAQLIPGAEILPQFAFVIIVLSNVYMTGGVLLAERRLRLSEASPAPPEPAGERASRPDSHTRTRRNSTRVSHFTYAIPRSPCATWPATAPDTRYSLR